MACGPRRIKTGMSLVLKLPNVTAVGGSRKHVKKKGYNKQKTLYESWDRMT